MRDANEKLARIGEEKISRSSWQAIFPKPVNRFSQDFEQMSTFIGPKYMPNIAALN